MELGTVTRGVEAVGANGERGSPETFWKTFRSHAKPGK